MKFKRALHKTVSGVLTFIALQATGCNNTLQLPSELKYKEDVVIQALLITSQKRQKILLTYTVGPEANNGWLKTVDKALVEINGVLFTHTEIDEYSSDIYNYYSDSLVVEPLQEYELLVVVDGDTITGQTICPGLCHISAEKDKVIWTRSERAYLYQIKGSLEGRDEYWFGGTVTTDTVYQASSYNLVIPSGWYEVTVYAFDKNYYDYTQTGVTSAGLDNGIYGFLGAMSVSRNRVYLSNP